MLTADQRTAIAEKAREHATKNVAFLKARIPGLTIVPTDGKTVKLAAPLQDGTYLSPVFRGKDMLFDDRETQIFASGWERIVNDAEARVLRYSVLDEVLASA